MLEFASLGSGSSGNATLVRAGGALVLVDCGFSVRELGRRARRLGVAVTDLTAVVVTHEHSDHTKGVGALARKLAALGVKVFMTPGTHLSRQYGDLPNLEYIQNYASFKIGALTVHPVPVPHDGADPVQYVFEAHGGIRLGVLTDIGSFNDRVLDAYQHCHALLIEANHDPLLLAQGPYPYSLKQRVGGAWGHLNNAQTAQFISQVMSSRLQTLMLGHMSAQNNTVTHVEAALSGCPLPPRVLYACQVMGSPWVRVAKQPQLLRIDATQ